MKLIDILIDDDNMAGLDSVVVITSHGIYNVSASDYSNHFLNTTVEEYAYCEIRCGNGDLKKRKAIFVAKGKKENESNICKIF